MLINTVLSIIFFGVYVLGGSVVVGARVGARSARRRATTPRAVEVQGFDVLKTYVCKSSTNTVKRQVDIVSGSTTISIPLRDLQALWLELQLLLLQINKILEDDGIDLSSLLNVPGATIVRTISGVVQTTTVPATSASPIVAAQPNTATNANNPIANTSPSETASSPATFPAAAVSTPGLVVTPATVPGNSPAQPTSAAGNQAATTPAAGNSPAAVTQGNGAPIQLGGTSVVGGTTIVGGVSATSTWDDDDVCWETTVTVQQTVPVAQVQTAGSAATTQANGAMFVATSVGSTPAAATSAYVFNPQSTENIAVYFGQTDATGGSSLVAQCADPNIDIVILSFIIQNAYQGTIYPLLNFGAACGGQTSQMIASAPGLLYCPDLAAMISSCQASYGKKVLLSIGGAVSAIEFTTSTQASDFATMLWRLFGPPGNIDAGLRPFGTVSIDGFDIDNEDNVPANFNVLGTTLKTAYSTDTSKSYYLTSAPQCPFPDQSNPLTLLLICDFVFVQFYNNPPCEIGSTGFDASLTQWTTALQASTSVVKPRLYIGAPAWSGAGQTAYANIGSPMGMQKIAKQSQNLGLPGFGGVAFWDGPEGMLNVEGGKDIIEWTKLGLTS